MAGPPRVATAIKATLLIALIIGAVLSIRWCYQHGRGVELRLHNVDKVPLRAIRVEVTGASYSLGDLAPGATTSVWAKPRSDSAVYVLFETPTGEERRLTVPHSYFEPGNSGWMSIELTVAEARNVGDHVELW